jgi:hypothetical protein
MTVLALFGVVACADVWGFSDLTAAPDAVAPDATPAGDSPVSVLEAGGDDEADVFALGADSGADAADARGYGEGGEGEGGRSAEGGAKDAGDDGAAAACKATCSGCCNSANHCVTPTATACGNGGEACVDCPACSTLQTPCCGATSGQCGCADVGLLCTKN